MAYNLALYADVCAADLEWPITLNQGYMFRLHHVPLTQDKIVEVEKIVFKEPEEPIIPHIVKGSNFLYYCGCGALGRWKPRC